MCPFFPPLSVQPAKPSRCKVYKSSQSPVEQIIRSNRVTDWLSTTVGPWEFNCPSFHPLVSRLQTFIYRPIFINEHSLDSEICLNVPSFLLYFLRSQTSGLQREKKWFFTSGGRVVSVVGQKTKGLGFDSGWGDDFFSFFYFFSFSHETQVYWTQ